MVASSKRNGGTSWAVAAGAAVPAAAATAPVAVVYRRKLRRLTRPCICSSWGRHGDAGHHTPNGRGTQYPVRGGLSGGQHQAPPHAAVAQPLQCLVDPVQGQGLHLPA